MKNLKNNGLPGLPGLQSLPGLLGLPNWKPPEKSKLVNRLVNRKSTVDKLTCCFIKYCNIGAYNNFKTTGKPGKPSKPETGVNYEIK